MIIRRCRANSGASGFTIIETMIVMAVSAGMLASAILLFSGQQRRTQFAQSLRDAESKIQDVLNDVTTGYFPSANNVSCAAAGSNEPAIDTSSSSEQGGNYDCVFMGKAIWLKPNSFVAYPIIGSRSLASSSTSTSTLSDVKPILATSLAEEKSFLWNSHIYAIYWNDATDRSAFGGMIAVASSANGTGTASGGGNFNSGIQRLNMYSSGMAMGTTVNMNEVSSSNAESAMKIALNSPNLSWVDGDLVILCIQDDGSGNGRQHGGIVISGRSQSVEARIQQEGDGPQCT